MTKQTILDIFHGNLNPYDVGISLKNYKIDLRDYISESDEFLKQIPVELHEKFNELCQMRARINVTEAEDAFIKGFQMATKLIVEGLSDFDGNEFNDTDDNS